MMNISYGLGPAATERTLVSDPHTEFFQEIIAGHHLKGHWLIGPILPFRGRSKSILYSQRMESLQYNTRVKIMGANMWVEVVWGMGCFWLKSMFILWFPQHSQPPGLCWHQQGLAIAFSGNSCSFTLTTTMQLGQTSWTQSFWLLPMLADSEE